MEIERVKFPHNFSFDTQIEYTIFSITTSGWCSTIRVPDVGY